MDKIAERTINFHKNLIYSCVVSHVAFHVLLMILLEGTAHEVKFRAEVMIPFVSLPFISNQATEM